MFELGKTKRAVTVGAAALTLALAGVASSGSASAMPFLGSTVPVRAIRPLPPGAVLIKELRTAQGVFDLYKRPGRPTSVVHAPVGGGVMRPQTADGCTGSDPVVCFAVNGSGDYVSSMRNETYYGHSTWSDMQIKDPNGKIAWGWGHSAVGGNWYGVDYTPNDYVTPGWWCGYSNANFGPYTGYCINVTN
ncbi:hypothetical protein ABZX95_40560 [Streptomyces sp. NPDC004232]|uniref:hypothetical protein n=1 Tax=unclassified Streptomyces TaxID=2593676 RepID=UPI001DD6C23A|nr:hypothetical protein [Streptomyces sp. tea 10]